MTDPLNIGMDAVDRTEDLNLSTLAWTETGWETSFCSHSLDALIERVMPLLLRHRGIKELHDWQKECLSMYALKTGRNVIISLPTSGGKTLIVEMLAMNEILTNRMDVIFIVPFISIAHEKVTALSPFGIELGFHIKEYAGSRGRFPPVKHRKKNSIYICTIEKAVLLIQSLLENNRLDEVGLVVVDEIHLLGNKTRGATLENILVRILYNGCIQIVGMSATIGNIEELAKFLKAEVYRSNFRPIELEEFVKIKNEIFTVAKHSNENPIKFHSRYTCNPKVPNEATFQDDPDDITKLVLDVIPDGSCLIFCPTKRSCENVARMLCQNLPRELCKFKKKEKSALYSDFLSENGGQICPILRSTISYGVAYHHAGLGMEERALIEEAYLSRTLQCICCTSTLAAGVNLPAERVIIRSPFVAGEFLSLATYKQMVGRAGRAGFGVKGESYLLCTMDVAAKVGALLTSKIDCCKSQLTIDSYSGLKSLILNSLFTGQANTIDDIMDIANITLFCIQNDPGIVNTKVFEIILWLISKHVIVSSDGTYKLTDLGRAIVKGNIEVEKSLDVLRYLNSALDNMVLLDRLHLLFLVMPNANELSKFKLEYQTVAYIFLRLSESELKVAKAVGIDELTISKVAAGLKTVGDNDVILKNYYFALILNNILSGMSLTEARKKYSLTKGDLSLLLSTTSASAAATTRFCEEIPKFWSFVRLMGDLPQMLMYCCKPELYSLMELPFVQKGRASQLYKAGFKDIKSVAKADAREMVKDIANFSFRQAEKIIVAAKLKMLSLAEELKEEAESLVEDIKDETFSNSS